MPTPTLEVENVLGMELDVWRFESCVAQFGTGDAWACLYFIESREPAKGHATAILTAAKEHYERQRKRVIGSVALNERMARLYEKVGIPQVQEAECD